MIHLCLDEIALATPLLAITLPQVRARLTQLRQWACKHKHTIRERGDDGTYNIRCTKCQAVTRLMTPVEYRRPE